MLDREKLKREFDAAADGFAGFWRASNDEAAKLAEIIALIEGLPLAEIVERLSTSRAENRGALPTKELEENGKLILEFANDLPTADGWRDWAMEILRDRTTFAADGSQFYFEKETSLPVGAVQVGWFENHHNAAKPYEKNTEFTMLTPAELLKDQDEPILPESRVSEVRFQKEVEKLRHFIAKHEGWQDRGERMPLGFFDGTLLVSFSLPHTALQKGFVRAIVELVSLSEEKKVPVVGYIDRSLSRDLIAMLSAFGGIESKNSILFDAAFLNRRGDNGKAMMQNWGDRTAFCISDRRGLDAFIDERTGHSRVGFIYMRTSADAPPSRIDIPTWVYREGLLDDLIDVVRAECVIGLGYPYSAESADHAAVLTMQDREVFLAALHELAANEKMDIRISRKNASKARRR